MVALLLILRLLSEVFSAVIFGLGGIALIGGFYGNVLAIVFFAVFIGTWARWIAPKSETRLEDPKRLWVEIVLFALSGFFLGISTVFVLGMSWAVFAIGLAVVTRQLEPVYTSLDESEPTENS